MIYFNTFRFIIATLAILSVNVATAESNKRLFLSTGISQQDSGNISQALTNQGYSNIQASSESSDHSWKIGYYHDSDDSPWVIGVSYVHLGDVNVDVSAALPSGKSNTEAARDIANSLPERGQGLTASSLYQIRLKGGFDVRAGAGIYLYRDERHATVGGITQTVNKRGLRPLTHFGVSYWLTPKVSVDAEWEHYFLSSEDVDHVGIGITYAF